MRFSISSVGVQKGGVFEPEVFDEGFFGGEDVGFGWDGDGEVGGAVEVETEGGGVHESFESPEGGSVLEGEFWGRGEEGRTGEVSSLVSDAMIALCVLQPCCFLDVPPHPSSCILCIPRL